MSTRKCLVVLIGLASIAAVAVLPAQAQFPQFISGSNEVDGAFNPGSGVVTVDLALAETGTWDQATRITPGTGVYDPNMWAVVFHYTTISVSSSRTVRFSNHPSGAPVVWLASGNVSITGMVDLAGTSAAPYNRGGPGGFDGGAQGPGAGGPGEFASAGFGPGGGLRGSTGQGTGSYGTIGASRPANSVYGNASIFPLIGGSGGGGHSSSASRGGHGGGAITIASSGNITLNGTVQANGQSFGSSSWNYSSGSGGAIRLVGNEITGAGRLNAFGGSSAGSGRIRVEGWVISLFQGSPSFVSSAPHGDVFPPATAPSLELVSVDSVAAAADPVAGVQSVDATINNGGPVTVAIAGHNVPLGTTVRVLVIPALYSERFEVTSTALAGTLENSTATATVTLPPGSSEIQLRANW